MDVHPVLIELNNKLLDVQKTIMMTMVALHNLHISQPVLNGEFMEAISPLYNAGLGELVESVDIDRLRADLTDERH